LSGKLDVVINRVVNIAFDDVKFVNCAEADKPYVNMYGGIYAGLYMNIIYRRLMKHQCSHPASPPFNKANGNPG
jgi:hypothetical protein